MTVLMSHWAKFGRCPVLRSWDDSREKMTNIAWETASILYNFVQKTNATKQLWWHFLQTSNDFCHTGFTRRSVWYWTLQRDQEVIFVKNATSALSLHSCNGVQCKGKGMEREALAEMEEKSPNAPAENQTLKPPQTRLMLSHRPSGTGKATSLIVRQFKPFCIHRTT